MPRYVLLCGGVGGAKLALGLSHVLAPDDLSIVVNTGDDFEHLGLTICPDIDTVLYTLGGVANAAQGWGREGESFAVLAEVKRLGGEDWFLLGDRDIALHLRRLALLKAGSTLTQATAELAQALGVRHRILPMSDQPVSTMLDTDEGLLPMQHYFVRRRCAPIVRGVHFAGAAQALPSKEAMAALADPDLAGIIIAPSNPFLSVDPILALPGLRNALRARGVPVVAVSPVIAGQAVKGPAAKMMAELGHDVSALGIARIYGGLADLLLIDEKDAGLQALAGPGMPRLAVAQTLMKTLEDRIGLARACLSAIAGMQGRRPS
jgi:LPPG:FO 2-phospho-L-lactate transferase